MHKIYVFIVGWVFWIILFLIALAYSLLLWEWPGGDFDHFDDLFDEKTWGIMTFK